MATPTDVAAWMLQALEERQSLFQEVAVYEIAAGFWGRIHVPKREWESRN
jgi:hypothetical protein